MTTTKNELPQSVKDMLAKINASDLFETLYNLSERWRDEKEYEDFNDYENRVKELYPFLNLIKMTKRPFGVIFNVDDIQIHYYLKVAGQYMKSIFEFKKIKK